MPPLLEAFRGWDNMMTMGWTNQECTSWYAISGTLLCACAFSLRKCHIADTIIYWPVNLNVLTESTSNFWYLNEVQKLHYFNVQYPQRHSWKTIHPPPMTQNMIISALNNDHSRTRSAPSTLSKAPHLVKMVGIMCLTHAGAWPFQSWLPHLIYPNLCGLHACVIVGIWRRTHMQAHHLEFLVVHE